MLVLLLATAFADELVLTDLRLDASSGVTLAYALSPTSWEGCSSSLRRTGSAPTLMVTVSAGGMTRSQAVELKEQVREGVVIASGTWPTGLTATIGLQNGGGVYDRLRGPSGSGTTLRVPVSGGTPGGDPLGGLGNTSSSSSSSSSGGSWTVAPQPAPVNEPYAPAPQPVQVDPQQLLWAAQEAERLAREAELARQRQEELDRLRAEQAAAAAAERARVEGIGNDPNDPHARSCGVGFGGDRYWDCIWTAVYRTDGPREVEGCGRMARDGLKQECLESLPKRTYQAGGAIHGCVDVFGPEVQSMRCLNSVVEAPYDPAPDIVACGRTFSAIPDQMACIARLRAYSWDPSALLDACAASFESTPIECVHMTAREEAPDAAMVRACGEHFDDPDALECIYELRGARPGDRAGVVPVCVELFADLKGQRQCLERARRDPSPDRIRGCASEEKVSKRLKCVEG